MIQKFSRISLGLVLLGALALVTTKTASAADANQSAEFAKQMDAYIADDANMEKVANALQRFVMKKQQEQMAAQAKAEQESMEDQFKNPLKVDTAGAPVKGNPNAKIAIVEFTDFQCPYCKRGAATMDEILKSFPNDVKLVYKSFPLQGHAQARPAAIAAMAANEQGKFWDMYQLLFASQDALNDEAFIKYAEQLKLDLNKFKADLKNEKLAKRVDDDMQQGVTLGIQGTPAFFVNGVRVSGARPASYFNEIINRWLKGPAEAPKPAEAKK